MGQLVRREEKGTSKWQYLVMAGMLAVASMYIFVKDVALPAQAVFFETMGSFSTVISVVWLPFLLAAAGGKFAEYYWNMFNRSSMISHSYEITETSLLRGLPSVYSVYGNVQVGNAEISHVVVGPNGVFVIADRSVNGTIYNADEQERRWDIEKVGRGGTSYTSSMANPLKQAKWQVHQLADCFKKNGCPNLWIEGAVLFSSGVVLSNSDKVFTSPDALVDYIVYYKPRNTVAPSAAAKANRILSDLGRLENADYNANKRNKSNHSPLKYVAIAMVIAVATANMFSHYQLNNAMKNIQHNKTDSKAESFQQQRDKILQDHERIRNDYERTKQSIDAQRNPR